MHVPRATYRVQLNYQFNFKKLREIIPYLAELGISEIYASPIFKARAKSLHGYDIVDPNLINPELGTLEELDAILADLKKRGMTWMQDIVPNHMALDSSNQMLMDIFENGKDSEYFSFFDIDWNHPYENMKGRMLVPVLGKFYAQALESGEIRLIYGEDGFKINYYQYQFPLKVGSYVQVLQRDMGRVEKEFSDNPDLIKYLGVINQFKALAAQTGDVVQSSQVRHAKTMLWQLYTQNESVKQLIDASLASFNSRNDNGHSFDPMDELISQQLYRLSFWKVATEEINYRRFFAISDLISVRVEDEKILNRTHELVFSLVEKNKIQSLRVDHVDGLYDPENYLARLRKRLKDGYLVVEKINFPDEDLPGPWPVQGTTGYDFMNYVNGLFCQKKNKDAFERIYHEFAYMPRSYDDLLCEKKRLIISKHLAGNIDNLAHQIKNISSQEREGRDITLYGLRRVLVEVMAHFPVYRTYINQETVTPEDAGYIKEAIEKAKLKIPDFDYELNFIEKFLMLQYGSSMPEEDKKSWLKFVMAFQQYTGPVMAKGFEDTMLYIYNPLVSLNEVGGSPRRFGFSPEEFHAFNAERAASMPYSMNATATHDTKRGEDVRARINVLSEIPQEWEACLKSWAEINKTNKVKSGELLAPDKNDEYLLYQTLLGTFPFEERQEGYSARIKEYFIKAIREAKRRTTWIKPVESYEQACSQFIEKLLDDTQENEFLKSFKLFQRKIASYGILNSLSQTVLKMTSPGVADFYQGSEYWDLTLVDPDNRRAVDYERRISDLQHMTETSKQDSAGLIKALLSNRIDDKIKMFVMHQLLKARNAYEMLFQQGEYIPLKTEGPYKENIIAFMRKHENVRMIAVVPRLLCSVVGPDQWPLGESVWKDTMIAMPSGTDGVYDDVMTGQAVDCQSRVPVGKMLAAFPAAVLISKF